MSHVAEAEVSAAHVGIVFENQGDQIVRIESDESPHH